MVAALPALHGQFGEDGEIQTLLELIGVPYVGSRSHACRVAYDKGTARELLAPRRHPRPRRASGCPHRRSATSARPR